MSIEIQNNTSPFTLDIKEDTVNLSIVWKHKFANALNLWDKQIKPELQQLLEQLDTAQKDRIQKIVINCEKLESFGKDWLAMLSYLIWQWRKVVFLHPHQQLIDNIESRKIYDFRIKDKNWEDIQAVEVIPRPETTQDQLTDTLA